MSWDMRFLKSWSLKSWSFRRCSQLNQLSQLLWIHHHECLWFDPTWEWTIPDVYPKYVEFPSVKLSQSRAHSNMATKINWHCGGERHHDGNKWRNISHFIAMFDWGFFQHKRGGLGTQHSLSSSSAPDDRWRPHFLEKKTVFRHTQNCEIGYDWLILVRSHHAHAMQIPEKSQ
jgi:hypothetical protein